MIPTLDKVRLDSSASLTLETGYTLGWSPDSAQYLTKLDGWTGSAPVRRTKSDIMNGHGTHAERGRKDERLVSVSGHYVAESRAAAAARVDEINAYLGDGTDGIFQVDDPDVGLRWVRCYLASETDVKWSGGVDVAFTVHLLINDPRKYGSAITSPATGIPVPGSGLRFPLFGAPKNGVLNLGAGGVSGKTSATNTGTADTGPIFTVTGDYVPEFTITDTATERRLKYGQLVVTGQVLTLDSNTGRVKLDGYADRGVELTVAQWSRLGPGQTGTWLFEAPGSLNASLTVEVVPAWW